jgi:hypothetical protein
VNSGRTFERFLTRKFKMLSKFATACVVLLNACGKPVLAFRPVGLPATSQRLSKTGSSHGRRVAVVVPAEPIPVGTVVGTARNVDRAAKAYPASLDSTADGPPVSCLRNAYFESTAVRLV